MRPVLLPATMVTTGSPGQAGRRQRGRSRSLRRTVLIGRDLDQAAVGVAAVDRSQGAAGALLGDRAFLDVDAVGLQMRHHLLGCAGCEKAEIATPCGFPGGGEPLDLVGVVRPYIDLLIAEHERGSRHLALARIEHPDLHAENGVVPIGRPRHVRNIDHEMVDRAYFDRHRLSFRRGANAANAAFQLTQSFAVWGPALAVPLSICYNASSRQYKKKPNQ